MNTLIADSGSTKTEWCVSCDGEVIWRMTTQGINPFHQSAEEITDIVQDMAGQLPDKGTVRHIEFYGAGCALPEKKGIVARVLQNVLSECTHVYVSSDLEGAARSVCQGKPGIACILGTGSNSCQFDGERIVANTPCLGYILGDEGSGAVLGRTLVGDCLKGQLPPHLCQAFFAECGLDQATLLERVYCQPLANRFLAGLTPFLSRHRAEPSVHTLLVNEFTRFFRRNVLAYDTSLPVHFVGSVAYHFSEEVAEAARSLGLTMGRIVKAPMDGLVKSNV